MVGELQGTAVEGLELRQSDIGNIIPDKVPGGIFTFRGGDLVVVPNHWLGIAS